MEVKIKKAETIKPVIETDKLGFGQHFTDHMFNMDYNHQKGWHNPRIEPYAPIIADPAMMVFHYAQAVFEGLKAFYSKSGDILLFRPKDNFKRLNDSCRAICIPQVDEEFALKALKQLIEIEKDKVPQADGTALYIRPTIVATDAYLGVKPSDTYRYFVILSPVGAYYAAGFNPIKIWITKNHVRAIKGGIGCYKAAANYAASLYAGKEAAAKGYAQVLWLDGEKRKYIEEVGAMNIFFVIDNQLITPELSGSILPGITRKSVIRLAKEWDIKVSERQISVEELIEAYDAGKLQEAFGSGTAAVISPVGEIGYDDKVLNINNGKVGEMTAKFYKRLTDIQYGRAEGPDGWVEKI
ncbi:MAG: branched-chain amino acid aminotransferase [Deltaproteobacteria bacterium]|nr:branched-chain amino acid aminotransferase [Deltaproteobacteria bacterium]